MSYFQSLTLFDRIILAQKITGLAAFSLIFVTILLGSFRNKLAKIFGQGIHKLHILLGILAFLFVVLHPLTYLYFNYRIKGILDPFSVFTDFCGLCKNLTEFGLTFGRISFWLLVVGIGAIVFRNSEILKKKYFKFHLVSYLAFFFIFAHLLIFGSGLKIDFLIFSLLVVAFAACYELFFRKKLK